MRPDDLTHLVRTATELVADDLEKDLERKLAPAREYLKYLDEIGDSASFEVERQQLEEREAMLREGNLPTWHISERKKDRVESVSGAADDIAPTINMPKLHDYVSVSVGPPEKTIDIKLAAAGATISVASSDPSWAPLAEAWAEQQLEALTPAYVPWVLGRRAPWIFVPAGILVGLAVAIPLVASGVVPLGIGAYVALGGLALAIAAGVAVNNMNAVVVSADLGSGLRGFRRELAWTIVGAMLGVLAAKLFDWVFPPIR